MRFLIPPIGGRQKINDSLLLILFVVSLWLSAFSESMPEMAGAGEDHGDAVLVGGGDDFFVA